MTLSLRGLYVVAFCAVIGCVVAAQAPSPAPPAASQADVPTFRVQIDAVTTDVLVRDSDGQFVPDLAKEDFELYEDGVKQDITSMTLSHGGRVTNVLEAPPAAAPEGIILPRARQVTDSSGRIFLFFVDDLHLQFQASGRVRELFRKIAKQLLHEGDLFGVVSSGPSSLHIDMTYNRKQLDDAIDKITGDGLKALDVINSGSGQGGPAEVRYRARTAFSTMLEGLENLEKVHNRRKALVWVSEGYDFSAFQNARLGIGGGPFAENDLARRMAALDDMPDPTSVNSGRSSSRYAESSRRFETFSDADLVRELAEVTRSANRANTTIYTIDPRGLVAGSDIDEQVEPRAWTEFVRKSQESMRVLADETGGVAIVNQNDFDKALKRIDNETSDYYVLGYSSNNFDLTKRKRKIEVKVARKGTSVWARKEYVLRRPPQPVSKEKR